MDNTCVCCGAVIPEGRMICWACENRQGVSPERRANGTVGTADRRTAGGSDADKQRLVGAGIEAGGQEQCGAEDAGGSGA